MADSKYRIAGNYITAPKRFGKMFVYQIGRTHCAEGEIIPEHIQLNYFELTAAVGGKGINITDGTAVPLGSGDIYVSFAGDFHSIISDENDPLKYDFITVQTEDTELSEALWELVETHHAPEERLIRDERIFSLISQAVDEMNSDNEHSEKLVEALVSNIIVYMIRAMKSRGRGAHISDVSDADVICFKVMNYIDSHIYTMKSLRELCDITSYSYNYLSNLFKKTTGGTLAEYYKIRRLESARLLLTAAEATVTEAAELLGYSSVYSFSTAFKKQFGRSPSAVKNGAR